MTESADSAVERRSTQELVEQVRPPNHDGSSYGPGYGFLGTSPVSLGPLLSASSSFNRRIPRALTAYQLRRRIRVVILLSVLGLFVGFRVALWAVDAKPEMSSWISNLILFGCAAAVALLGVLVYRPAHSSTYVHRGGLFCVSKPQWRPARHTQLPFKTGLKLETRVSRTQWYRAPLAWLRHRPRFVFAFSDATGELFRISGELPQWPPSREHRQSVDHPWYLGRAAERAFTAFLASESPDVEGVRWFALGKDGRIGVAEGRLTVERGGERLELTEPALSEIAIASGALVLTSTRKTATTTSVPLREVTNRAYLLDCIQRQLACAQALDPESAAGYM